MNIRRKNFTLLLGTCLVAGIIGFLPCAKAEEAKLTVSEGTLGLPSVSSDPKDANIVGILPQSTQWIAERTGSFLYLSYNATRLASQRLVTAPYISDYGSREYAYPGFDFFSRLFSFANPESTSFFRNFAAWGRYSLGVAIRKGQLSSTMTPIDSSVEENSLLLISGRVGFLLGFERWQWFRPYLGMEISPYGFRNTSGISGAELQGGAFTYSPVIGSHFPLFSGKVSLMAEARKIFPYTTSGQLFDKSSAYTLGLGVTF